ncbi:MAG: hypothetical protein RSH26_02005 [Clostridia bacterium]
MTNIFDYLAWRGDLRFSQAEPCEVDFLIFAQLVHAPLERLMGGGQGWTLSELQPIVYPTPVGADQNVLALCALAGGCQKRALCGGNAGAV